MACELGVDTGTILTENSGAIGKSIAIYFIDKNFD
jgi:hypothetical protein